MKQNMCVTIDEEIYKWIRSRDAKMSRVVNNILASAMWKEMKQRAINSGEQEQLPIEMPIDHYCPSCETTQTGLHNWCSNHSCRDRGQEIHPIVDQNDQ